MKVLILDDWYNNISGLPCFEALKDHDVIISTDRVTDPPALAGRLNAADAVILFRDRTAITADVAARLNGRGLYLEMPPQVFAHVPESDIEDLPVARLRRNPCHPQPDQILPPHSGICRGQGRVSTRTGQARVADCGTQCPHSAPGYQAPARPAARVEGFARRAIAQPAPVGESSNRAPGAAG